MERELNCLLSDLCIKWGFCLPPDAEDEISKAPFYYAEDFAKDVIEAEGMNAEHESKWVKEIARKFRERFGDNEINVSNFVDRVRGQNENW